MQDILVKLQEWTVLYGLKLIAAVAIFIIGRLAAKTARTLVTRVLEKARVDPTLSSFVTSLTYVAILVFVVIAALGQLGVQTASFVAVLAAAGLAVGLALQGSLSNFAAGVLMIIFKPFKIGDFIEAGGADGVVEQIGIFTTELKTADNKRVIVPNSKAIGDCIINYSTNAERRVDLVASVGYLEDIDKVRCVLEQILAADPRILKDPAPTIGVLKLAESSVDFAVRPWVKNGDYWDVFFALQEQIKKQFDAQGIVIPFPQQDVHLHQPKI